MPRRHSHVPYQARPPLRSHQRPSPNNWHGHTSHPGLQARNYQPTPMRAAPFAPFPHQIQLAPFPSSHQPMQYAHQTSLMRYAPHNQSIQHAPFPSCHQPVQHCSCDPLPQPMQYTSLSRPMQHSHELGPRACSYECSPTAGHHQQFMPNHSQSYARPHPSCSTYRSPVACQQDLPHITEAAAGYQEPASGAVVGTSTESISDRGEYEAYSPMAGHHRQFMPNRSESYASPLPPYSTYRSPVACHQDLPHITEAAAGYQEPASGAVVGTSTESISDRGEKEAYSPMTGRHQQFIPNRSESYASPLQPYSTYRSPVACHQATPAHSVHLPHITKPAASQETSTCEEKKTSTESVADKCEGGEADVACNSVAAVSHSCNSSINIEECDLSCENKIGTEERKGEGNEMSISKPNDVCPICLEQPIKDPRQCKQCRKFFCDLCYVHWASYSGTCAHCRSDVSEETLEIL